MNPEEDYSPLSFFMKRLSYIFFGILLLLIFLPFAFAAEIQFSADVTTGTTDDIFQVSLSVDGDVDGGKIGLVGLENFEIVGEHFSSQIQILNGKTTSIQEKILSLRPKKAGNFTLIALARENEKEIRSTPLSFQIQKSVVQSTKEKLLQGVVSSSEEETTPDEVYTEDKSVKQLLTAPQNIISQKKDVGKIDQISLEKIQDFPSVQHFSAFNAVFWGQFLGSLFILLSLFFGISFWQKSKKK